MVELVITIVLVGILSVVVLPKFFSTATFNERGYFDESVAAVRYAQKLAIASGCDVQAAFSATGYVLTQRAGCTTGSFTGEPPVPHPARSGGFQLAPPSGVTVGTTASLYFDKIGRPRNPAGSPPNNLLSGITTVAIGTRTLTIEPQTGYVH